MNTNHVLLIGYVGADPIMKSTDKGSKRVSLRVATHMPFKNWKGEKTWNTVWHDIIAWDQTADYATQNFLKGSKVLIDGHIHYYVYPDKTGHLRYSTQIKAHSLMNLDR